MTRNPLQVAQFRLVMIFKSLERIIKSCDPSQEIRQNEGIKNYLLLPSSILCFSGAFIFVDVKFFISLHFES